MQWEQDKECVEFEGGLDVKDPEDDGVKDASGVTVTVAGSKRKAVKSDGSWSTGLGKKAKKKKKKRRYGFDVRLPDVKAEVAHGSKGAGEHHVANHEEYKKTWR